MTLIWVIKAFGESWPGAYLTTVSGKRVPHSGVLKS